MREIDVEALPHQMALLEDRASPVLVLEGGLGCGKTVGLLLKVLDLVEQSPGVPGLIVEPTADLVGTILLPTIEELFSAWGIEHEFRTVWRGRRDVLLLHPGTRAQTAIYLRSGDRPHRIVGFKVGWLVLDEADQMQREVWRRATGRMRDRRSRCRQRVCVFTPEPGFNWTWSAFHESPEAGTRCIVGVPTSANVFNPIEYAGNLAATHDEADRARVLTGARAARTGLVYRRFDEGRHVVPYDLDSERGPLEVWADFNVRKMAWALVSVRGDRAHVVGEVVREDTDTMAQADETAALLAEVYARRMGLRLSPTEAARMTTVICDASGDSASTSSKQSDVAILISRGFRVRHPARNPFIEDSVLAVNRALEEGWLVFDRARAPYTTRCIASQPYGDDGKPAKAKDVKAGLDHGADVVRYGVFHHRPAWAPRGNGGLRVA